MKAHSAFVSLLCPIIFAPLTVVGQTHSPGDILFQRTDGLSVAGDDFTGALPDNTDTALPFGVLDDPNASIITQINVDTEGGAPAHGIDLVGDNFDLAFTFQLYDSDGQFSFTENFDDRVQVTITPIVSATDLTATGGSMVHSDVAWNVRTFGDYNFASGGWFDAQVLMTEDGGGAQSAGGIGFGFSNAASTANEFDYALVGGGAVFDTDGNGESFGSLIISFDHSVDVDGDGIPDGVEVQYFPGDLTQLGTGDFDGDGVNDPQEIADGTDPTEADADGDGLNDGEEKTTGTDPHNADSDGDGLSDGDEVNTHGTDPNNSDTDGDGSPDAQEIADGGDPNNPNDAGFFESFSFDTDDGGFTQEATGNSPIPSTHDAVRGTWPMVGDDSGPATNTITSPNITMPETGGLLILLNHRYSIEADWDGTALQFSRNGGPFVTVPIGAFTQNGYTFTGLIGNHVLSGGDGFNGVSPGYAAGTFITSVANFGGAATGDTFQVRFLGAWDEGARGAGIPNWEIDSVSFKVKSDADGDGMPDDYEDATPGLDKNVDDAAGDLDGEGLSNLDEFLNGSDPNEADTDGDGSDDNDENTNGTDPTNPDSDGDGLTDGVETNTGVFNGASDTGSDPNNNDTDGDGFKDFIEVTNGGDPNDSNIRPAVTQITSLGTGTGALRGGDLTDPEDDGVEGNVPGDGDWTTLNWNWVSIQASEENYFGNFGGSEGAYDLFDNQVGGGQAKWCCSGPPQWLTVEFEEVVSLDSFTVTAGNDTPGRDPLTWGIYGSNDNVTFEPIFEQDDPISLWTQRLEVIEFKLPRSSKPYKFIKYEVTQTQVNHQINEIEYFGQVNPPSLFLDVASSGDDLVLTWESGGGELFNLRSETDLSNGEPLTWPIFDGHEDIVATPPFNTLTIPRPVDSERFFAIEVFPAPPESIFSDDFESGQGDWTFGSDGAAGTAWELGVPTNGPGVANSLVNCFGTNLTSDYAVDADVWLRSPAIDLTTAGGATLNYYQHRDIEEGFDFGIISVLDAADDSLIVEIPGIDSGAFAWELVSKSLPVEALGKAIKIEFRLTSDEIETFPGWFIDDFEITVP